MYYCTTYLLNLLITANRVHSCIIQLLLLLCVYCWHYWVLICIPVIYVIINMIHSLSSATTMSENIKTIPISMLGVASETVHTPLRNGIALGFTSTANTKTIAVDI